MRRESAGRIIRLQGRRHRYQELPPREVLRLLEKPDGTIATRRVDPVPSQESLEDLIAAFREAR